MPSLLTTSTLTSQGVLNLLTLAAYTLAKGIRSNPGSDDPNAARTIVLTFLFFLGVPGCTIAIFHDQPQEKLNQSAAYAVLGANLSAVWMLIKGVPWAGEVEDLLLWVLYPAYVGGLAGMWMYERKARERNVSGGEKKRQ